MTELEPLLRKFQKELSAGTVSLALLAVMAAAAEPMYGYQIAKRLEHIGEGVLADSSFWNLRSRGSSSVIAFGRVFSLQPNYYSVRYS